jgi:hypothetical protein
MTMTCPVPATLAALADGTLGPAREDVVSHVSSCDRCLDSVGALVHLSRAQPPVLPAKLKAAAIVAAERSARAPRTAARWQSAAAVAATVTLGLGGWYYVQRDRVPTTVSPAITDDRVRSTQTDMPAPRLRRPLPGARVPPGPLQLEWHATPSAIAYRVHVMRDDGQLLWERETQGTATEVPETASLPSAVPLYVAVTAVLPDGKTTRAPAVRFEVSTE